MVGTKADYQAQVPFHLKAQLVIVCRWLVTYTLVLMKPPAAGTHATLPSSFQTDHPPISNPESLGIHTCWKLAAELMNCTGFLSTTHL